MVYKATFANPFGEERAKADAEISGLSLAEAPEKRLEAAIGKTESCVERLSDSAAGLNAEDRDLLEKAQLFCIFHRYADGFDELIRRQREMPADQCRAAFAPAALTDMAAMGLPDQVALRYFATFYQLRRAYYFINEGLTGRSASMQRLRSSLWNNIFTCDMGMYVNSLWNRMEDFSTLILGETGTGKGSSASAIGRSGFIPFNPSTECFAESFMQSFISINLSQFPENLIESELFGHRKGAFTGAVEAHQGIFDRCSGHGAIFLDEIGDVPQPIQIKLLQVLQERRFTPVGSHEERRFNGRVIAATNQELDRLRAESLFREDFFYRLCSDTIYVPPLRERLREHPEELDDLIRHVLSLILGISPRNPRTEELSGQIRMTIARKLGPDYSWPGNVRELEQHTRSILLTGTCRPSNAPSSASAAGRLHRGIDNSSYTVESLLSDYCTLLYERCGTYEEVARLAEVDRRTAKKYIHMK